MYKTKPERAYVVKNLEDSKFKMQNQPLLLIAFNLLFACEFTTLRQTAV